MEDYFLKFIKTGENNEHPVDIKKGICTQNPFPDGRCQSEKILLNQHMFLAQKQLCQNEVDNQNYILNIDTAISIEVRQGIFVFYT